MPANEQTWRDSKLLHVVFGISSIVMLVTTIWMMADDHNRPWKEYQRTFRNLDVQTTDWRAAEQESTAYKNDLLEYEKKLAESRAKFTAGDRNYVDAFLKEFKEDETAFVALAASQKRSFPSLYDRDAAKQLSDAANALVGEKDAETIRKDRAALLKALDDKPFLKSLRFREDNLTAEVK